MYLQSKRNYFYNGEPSFLIEDKYKDLITQHYIINLDGTINRDYLLNSKINDMHKFFNIVYKNRLSSQQTENSIKITNNSYLLLNSTNTEEVFGIFNYVEPSYTLQPNNYWWDKTQIFTVTTNWNRATFILFIIIFCFYFLLITFFLIKYHFFSDFKSVEDKENYVYNQSSEFYPSYKNLSFTSAFALNLKQGLYSGFIRKEKIRLHSSFQLFKNRREYECH